MVYRCTNITQVWRLRKIYPPICLLCGTRAADGPDLDLCDGCRQDLPLAANGCWRCGRPLPAAAGHGVCGTCQRQPPPFDQTLVLAHYAPPVDRLIQRLKFSGQLNVARLLGALLAERAAMRAQLPEALVPVPLHSRRLRQRGYNQALEIARVVGEKLDMPVLERSCQRSRATPPQSDLPARARSANVRGAFTAGDLRGIRSLAIVDDVMTTGSTVAELAHGLRRQGARHIEVWVCARTR